MASLVIDQVYKKFGDVEVLKGINISIEPGEFLVLVGPSGCGKSTLLNLIAGLDSISTGEIRIGDRVVNKVQPKDRDIAMVFQSYALYPNMTIEKNLSFGLETRKVPKDEIAKQISKVAEILQIEDLLDRKPSQLSGGQRQRVAMGRAIARDPVIFLFDEPLSNLDAKLRVEMRAEIKKLHQRLGTTIVYVTHDQIEAMTMADRIAIMKDGIVQQFDSPDKVYSDPTNLFVAGFIGSPSMNFIPVTFADSANGTTVTLANEFGEQFEIPLPRKDGFSAGTEATLGVRPENITDSNGAIAGRAQTATISCEVKVVEPTGPDTLVHVEINGTEVLCRASPEYTGKPGEQMELALDTSKLLLFDGPSGERIDREGITPVL